MIAGLQLSHTDILSHINIPKEAEVWMLGCPLKLIDDILRTGSNQILHTSDANTTMLVWCVLTFVSAWSGATPVLTSPYG